MSVLTAGERPPGFPGSYRAPYETIPAYHTPNRSRKPIKMNAERMPLIGRRQDSPRFYYWANRGGNGGPSSTPRSFAGTTTLGVNCGCGVEGTFRVRRHRMLDQEIKYYESQREKLLASDRDKFVLIKGEKIIGIYDSEAAAYT